MDTYRMMIFGEVGWLLFGWLLWAWWRERNLRRELVEVITTYVKNQPEA